ncbi:MAG: head GIN domain-containing protein [Fulvivirga sp.]|uniref:head GIN domain-containing protein n=1 Tax=Fulvivirga sp. TaxID=1931237 RepID=UPI0032EC6F0B
MKSIIIVFALLLSNTLTFGFGSDVTRKTLELAEFSAIYVNSGYTVHLKQSNKQEVTVEAISEIFDLTKLEVENGILHINIERKQKDPDASIWSKIDDIKISPTMNVYISVRDINTIKVNGNGKVVSENSLAANTLNLSISGSGSMNLDVKGKEVKTEVSGSGDLKLKGYATSNTIKMSGSGSIHAFECDIQYAEVEQSGSGVCEINVSQELEAKVYGSGSIKHKGSTKSVTKKVYGSGEIDRAY